MKKITRIALALAAVTLLFASCKSHEKCPAYGQSHPTNKIEKQV
ncbi:MAG TPA: hypothetical protein PK950_01405 [Candidatus Paceibacterota bacterium]|nr:hypothetical protein [Candidatus Paceibacterota bacterium]